MENNENLANQQETAGMAENVGVTTEQVTETPPETVSYTREQFDSIVGEKKARAKAQGRAQAEREFKKKYEKHERLSDLLCAVTGKEDLDEVYASLSEFYSKQGKTVPTKPKYSDRDIGILAEAEANGIIRAGYEDVVDEVNRLAALGKDGMDAKEKATFRILVAHRQKEERNKELAKLGVTETVYNGKEFQDFAAKFDPRTPIREVYDIFVKSQPTKDIQTMGSVKNTGGADDGIKDFYTPEEAKKFTKKDFDNNPKLWKAVLGSMPKWKK